MKLQPDDQQGATWEKHTIREKLQGDVPQWHEYEDREQLQPRGNTRSEQDMTPSDRLAHGIGVRLQEPRLPIHMPPNRGQVCPGDDPMANPSSGDHKYSQWKHERDMGHHETYAEELRRRARERGQELRDSVPTPERDQDRSDDLER